MVHPANSELSQAEGALYAVDDRVCFEVSTHRLFIDGKENQNVTDLGKRIIGALILSPDESYSAAEVAHTVYGYVDKSAVQSLRVGVNDLKKRLRPSFGTLAQALIRTRKHWGMRIVSSLDTPYATLNSENPSQLYSVERKRLILSTRMKIMAVDNEPVELTPALYGIMEEMIINAGILRTNVHLIEVLKEQCAYRGGTCSSVILYQSISKLRAMLGPELGDKSRGLISLVPKEGYILHKSLSRKSLSTTP